MDCCSAVLIATNRIVGRLTASQMATGSIASDLPRFTYDDTYICGINRTSWPNLVNSRAQCCALLQVSVPIRQGSRAIGVTCIGWLLLTAQTDICCMAHCDIGWSKSHPPHQLGALFTKLLHLSECPPSRCRQKPKTTDKILFSVAHALETYTIGRARNAVASLAGLTPDAALMRRGDKT